MWERMATAIRSREQRTNQEEEYHEAIQSNSTADLALALEEEVGQIAKLIRDFLARNLNRK